MIAQQQAQVFFAPTARRRFLTRKAAINAEARAIIKKHFPDERGCRGVCEACYPYGCGDTGWTLETGQPDRFQRYYRLLTTALKKVQQ